MTGLDNSALVLLAMADAKRAPFDKELVLSVQPEEDGKMAVAYYFASMSERCVFWPEEVDVSLITGSGKPVSDTYAGMCYFGACYVAWIWRFNFDSAQELWPKQNIGTVS